MNFKRKEQRKNTISSEENDNEENYAKIQFQVEFPTNPKETLYM